MTHSYTVTLTVDSDFLKAEVKTILDEMLTDAFDREDDKEARVKVKKITIKVKDL